jgi:DNA segregation ATPase FtsK/SpoIIIE, S-DNA-T family
MTSRSPAGKPPAGVKAAGDAPAVEDENQDILVGLWIRFRRFGWDVLGIGLLALGLLTLLGLLGLTRGLLVDPWVGVVRQGLGLGYPILIIGLAVLGLVSLRRHFSSWPKVPLGRILALEGAAFTLLALLAIFGGLSVDRSEAGLDGGVIGWGLANPFVSYLPGRWGIVVLTALLAVFLALGTGIFTWSVHRLEAWLNAVEQRNRKRPAEAGKSEEGKQEEAEEESEQETPLPSLNVQPTFDLKTRDPRLPPLNVLLPEQQSIPDESAIAETGNQIERTMAEFGLPVRVLGYRIGPTITQYAVEPGFNEKPGPDGEISQQKVRVAQISALQRDLALALRAERLRIEAPVPGRSYVGIEVPNPVNSVVRLRALMESEAFTRLSSSLAVALGKDVSGQPVVADLARMPHLLIAGTTGSGKSVCIAALVTCLALNNTPDRLRMALLDPKMVELARLNGLPHLFGKVESDVDRMLGVLKWALIEMDQRYRILEDARTRDIDTYNRRAEKRHQPTLPRIVVVIDELADLMMSAPDQTEHSLVRLAQMARAVGIHLVVATQRPSTDVVTGLIKANFPARIAFTVASGIDSRVILDTNGAETLLGKGDMLWLNPEVGSPQRLQGVMVADSEVDSVIAYWNRQKTSAEAPVPPPWEELIAQAEEEENSDALVEEAIQVVKHAQRASVSLLQRRLRIGYPRAARLIDQLEEMGIVGPSQGAGKDRDVLVEPDEEDEDPETNEDAA